MPEMVAKLGLLSAKAVREITDVYVGIDYFQPRLLAVGGKNEDTGLRHTLMQSNQARYVENLARGNARRIDAVLAMLRA
jgi:hypothetical protein